MKFTDGFWMKKKGVEIYSPAQVQEVQVEPDRVTVWASHVKVEHRGQTLNAPLLRLRFTSPQPGMLAVEAAHFLGGCQKEPRFRLEDRQCPLEVSETADTLTIRSGALEAKLDRREFSVSYSWNGRYLTGSGKNRMGYITAPDGAYWREQLELSVGEKIYGLGERFTPFVKNGQTVDIWNEDGGTSSELSYKNIPFYLSSRGYGVLVDDSGKVSYEIASEAVSHVQFSVPGELLRYVVIGGDDRKDALSNYTALTGRPALPPAWSFGLWLSTSFTTDYDEKTVSEFVDGMLTREIPLRVFHFDCFWMKAYEWCNFQWDPDQFPDVEGMLTRLKAKGLKICVWINPYIAQRSPLFAEAAGAGYLLKRPDGGVWQWDMWQDGMGLVDFTNPAARQWFCSKLKVLLDQGVDCFKTDFGERIPTDCVYFDGSDPVKMHNYYTLLYNETVFHLLERERGRGEAVLFARSATAGGQRFPIHWGGDCDSRYYSMAESLRGGLSLAMSGFGFWSHDISGFESTATPDLYKRWSAFGLLSTHSRLHGSGSYRVPWLFDEEAVAVLRFFSKLKCRLMPYLYSAACETAAVGIPVMRAMPLEFDDPACLELDRQYMLGKSLLAAPILREDSVGEYYLPKGTWTHFLTGEIVEGGSWHKDSYDYFSLPLFVRENSILAVGGCDSRPDYNYGEGLTLHLFALKEGAPASAEVYNPDGSLLLSAEAVRSGSEVTVTMTGTPRPELLLRGAANIAALSGAKAVQDPQGIRLAETGETVSFRLE